MPVSGPRILEIGDFFYVKSEYPERTTLLWTGRRPPRDLARSEYADCTPRRFRQAMSDLRKGGYDFVVCYVGLRSAWHPLNWLRSIGHEPLAPLRAATRVFGVAWLRYVDVPVPLVALDMNDPFVIGRHGFFLLDKADVFFKRELPADRWHVLCGSAHANVPTRRIRRRKRWQERLAKIRPLSLPMPLVQTTGLWEGDSPEKSVDVFFSGEIVENSWVRRAGLPELKAIADRGYVVDAPRERLPPEEFYRRLSRAWLAWSPAGFSWECYRTGEAAQCLCVPLVSNPTVERHWPLRNGEHLFHYDIEPGGLTRAVESALSDKARLRRMASAAREHVLAHHTTRAMVDFVIETALKCKHEASAACELAAAIKAPE